MQVNLSSLCCIECISAGAVIGRKMQGVNRDPLRMSEGIAAWRGSQQINTKTPHILAASLLSKDSLQLPIGEQLAGPSFSIKGGLLGQSPTPPQLLKASASSYCRV